MPVTGDIGEDRGHGEGANPILAVRGQLKTLVWWLPTTLMIAGAVAAWEGIVAINDIPQWKLPAPSDVAIELWESRSLLLTHTWVTLEEVLVGFAIALACGILLAGLIATSRTIERVIYPPAIASQTLPIIVIAPLLLTWVGYGLQHKVVVVALISFFPIVVNTVDGLRSADPDMINLLRALGANRWQVFVKAQIPTCLPFMFSGIKIAITVSVIGAVVGEWVGSSEGLGYLAIRSKSQFLTERVFAAIFLLGVMGIGLFMVAGTLERILLPWYHDQRRQRALNKG